MVLLLLYKSYVSQVPFYIPFHNDDIVGEREAKQRTQLCLTFMACIYMETPHTT
jgi:hypothetical protein